MLDLERGPGNITVHVFGIHYAFSDVPWAGLGIPPLVFKYSKFNTAGSVNGFEESTEVNNKPSSSKKNCLNVATRPRLDSNQESPDSVFLG